MFCGSLEAPPIESTSKVLQQDRGLLPNYDMGILISQYKDPYKPTSIMESRRGLFRSSDEFGGAPNLDGKNPFW